MTVKKLTLSLVLLLSAGIIGLMILSANTHPKVKSSTKLQIVTSLPLVKNIVDKIGGNQVTVESIVHGPNCDHEYEPSSKDMRTLADSAVFIKIGLGSDPWTDKLAAGTLRKEALFVDASKGIQMIKVRGLDNPHYWGSPDNVKLMAKNILTALNSAKPNQKVYFESNYQKLVASIDQTVAQLKAKVATLKNKKLASYSGAFPYFYHYFGFETLMTVELSCEQEVSPKDIADAAKLMQAQNIKILVGDAAEPNEPDGLVAETHATKILLWGTTDASNDYLTTLRHNVEYLVKALQ